MMFSSLSCLLSSLFRVAAFGAVLLFVSSDGFAQFSAAPTPIADPVDHRFDGSREDWTSLALDKSHLTTVPPLAAFQSDYPKYTVELLQVQWRPGDPIDLYVMKPKGVKNPPVILYLYGYPTDTDIFRNDDYEELVTRDGVAAVGFVSALTGHRYHDRPMKEWFLSELQESLVKSAHDVQMVLNYLATRGDLDMNRVGMFAQGSGASIAVLASTVDSRIKVLEALDPWGDWPKWLATSPFVPPDERALYIKPDFLEKVAALDPVILLPKIQTKQFRLDAERFDTVTPQDIKQKFRNAAAAGSTINKYETLDDFKAAFATGDNLLWIQRALRALPPQPDIKH